MEFPLAENTHRRAIEGGHHCDLRWRVRHSKVIGRVDTLFKALLRLDVVHWILLENCFTTHTASLFF